MAQRLLNRLFQDTELGNIIRESEPLLIEVLNEDAELGNVIRDSEPLLIEVLNEERELVIVDNNTREVRDADIEQAFTIVADTADISEFISLIGDQDIGGSHETFGDNDNSEEHGNVDKQFGFCMYCIKYEPVQTHDQLKRGDCIRFPKKGGLYYHHAIVKEVQEGSTSSCCTLTLIHLQKIGRPILTRVIEETNTYDVREEIVEKVIYKSNPFSPVEIIRRAEEYAAKNETPRVYNLFRNNCEHLSNQFAQGVKISHQVYSKLEQLTAGCLRILNVLCRIGSKIMRLRGIASLVSIVSLTDIIRSIIQLKKFFRDNIVCFCCYGNEYKKLKRALVLGVISLAVSIINHFNWGTLTLNLIITIALPFVVPLVYTHVMPLIRPAFLIPKQKLSIKNIPRTGDIITFDYHNLPHEGVVSDIHGLGSDMTRLKATIIHFPWPGMLKTFTVTEETIYFSQTDDVSVLDFEGTHHLPASVVVWKARKELGKQNHNHFTYRSCHLSRYCKTGSKNITTLPTVPVRSMNDLSPGDLIRFRYFGVSHEAVLVKIAEAENIRINVIHYNYDRMLGTKEVVNEEMTFKLSDENVHIHDYANVEAYEPEEVVRRAKSRVGEQKFNPFTNRSSHLAKWCKIKQN